MLILIINASTNAPNKMQLMTSINFLCFVTGVPSSGSLSERKESL